MVQRTDITTTLIVLQGSNNNDVLLYYIIYTHLEKFYTRRLIFN